jgi:hypothetical protein
MKTPIRPRISVPNSQPSSSFPLTEPRRPLVLSSLNRRCDFPGDNPVCLFTWVQFVKPVFDPNHVSGLKPFGECILPEEAVSRRSGNCVTDRIPSTEREYTGVNSACDIQRGRAIEIKRRPVEHVSEKCMRVEQPCYGRALSFRLNIL